MDDEQIIDALKLSTPRGIFLFTWIVGTLILSLYLYSHRIYIDSYSLLYSLSILPDKFVWNSKWYTLLSYNLMHSSESPLHFGFNFYFFLIISQNLEIKMGSIIPLLILFFGGGAIGGTMTLIYFPDFKMIYGSSAGISSLFGAFLVYAPKQKINILFFENIFCWCKNKVKIQLWILTFVWVILNLLGFVSQTKGVGIQIAHSTHIFGFISGFFLGYIFLIFGFDNFAFRLKVFKKKYFNDGLDASR